MQVCRAYFKVIKKHYPSLIIYFAIFLLLAVIVSSSLKGQTSAEYNKTESNIAIINNDSDSPLNQGLVNYLSSNAKIVKLNDNNEDIQDALFYGNVSYVLRIPAGFSQSFASGTGNINLQKTTSAISAMSVNIDMLINRYLNLSGLYAKNGPSLNAGEIENDVLSDLQVSSQVDFASDKKQTATINMSYYFRIIAYSILAIIIMGITNIMMSFNKESFSRRNQCSPMKPNTMNLQMILANATFAFVVWVIMCIFIFLLYGEFVLSTGILLMCLNALIFTIASLGIGFLAGKFVKDHVVQAAVTNVVALGICFISGVFVSQELLGRSALKIASFTPGYWYIKAIQDIIHITSYSTANMLPVIYSMLIQLGFAAAFIIIALAVPKKVAD